MSTASHPWYDVNKLQAMYSQLRIDLAFIEGFSGSAAILARNDPEFGCKQLLKIHERAKKALDGSNVFAAPTHQAALSDMGLGAVVLSQAAQ